MNKLKKGNKCDKIKSDVIKGRQHFAHKSGSLILERKQTLVFNCFCEKKCSNLLTESQKIEVFNRYNNLKSHSEQYLFLKSLVIPDNNIDKKNLKFNYYIEARSEEKEVKIYSDFLKVSYYLIEKSIK
jgi:hypothetical protein